MIGEISSYLPQKDYLSLSKTNKSLYIGCNDPNTLQHLDLKKVDNYSAITLELYPKLKHLEVRIQKFDQLLLPKNKHILPELSQITFDGNWETDADLSSVRSQQAISFDSIKTLTLKCFGKSPGETLTNRFSAETFVQLIAIFPNVNHFDTMCSALTPFTNDQQIQYRSFCSKLNEVSTFYTSNNIRTGLMSNPALIRKLKFVDLGLFRNITTEQSFSNLEELSILSPTSHILKTILKTAHSVTTIELHAIPTMKQIKEVMTKLFKIPSMTNLLVTHVQSTSQTSYENVGNICDGIIEGLDALKDEKYQRERLKIVVAFKGKDITGSSKRFVKKISEIVGLMREYIQSHFMIIVDIRGVVDDEWIKEITKYRGDNEDQFKFIEAGDNFRLVVANEDCDIVAS